MLNFIRKDNLMVDERRIYMGIKSNYKTSITKYVATSFNYQIRRERQERNRKTSVRRMLEII